MKSLESEILAAEKALERMSRQETRALDKSLRELTHAQRRYVRDTLRMAHLDHRAPAHYINLLEHFFEKWAGHSLATRIVLIDRIVLLANDGVSSEDLDRSPGASRLTAFRDLQISSG